MVLASLLLEKGLDLKTREHAVKRAPIDVEDSCAAGDISLIMPENVKHVALFDLLKARRVMKKKLFILGAVFKWLCSRRITYRFGKIVRGQY